MISFRDKDIYYRSRTSNIGKWKKGGINRSGSGVLKLADAFCDTSHGSTVVACVGYPLHYYLRLLSIKFTTSPTV
jgi:hypothetical protein